MLSWLGAEMKILILPTALLFLGLIIGTSMTAAWFIRTHLFDAVAARQAGFESGINYAQGQQNREASLGLCVYSSVVCKGRK